MKVKYLIIGAGVSGLSFATNLDEDYIIIEKESGVGGLCRTIKQNGFTWDYSGHFFHFRDEGIKKTFLNSMNTSDILYKEKNTKIYIDGKYIDFPFQKNIHQLNKKDFINCLYDLYFKEEKKEYLNFEEMLYGKFGKSITDMFLKPYNEKLYACNLNSLETDAMGRFFPYANFEEIIRNMKDKDNSSYNDTFLYPRSGAFSFIEVLLRRIDKQKLLLNCSLKKVNIEKKIAYTDQGVIEYDYLINTMPFNQFCNLMKINTSNLLSSNKVLVFNLGFSNKSNIKNTHWLYFPEKKYNFYRVGFYDNILDENRLSLYVEIGFKESDEIDIEKELRMTLQNLDDIGITTGLNLINYTSIIMNPAYVHLSENSEKLKKSVFDNLNKKNIFSIGRYGKWVYCSIEDCILDANALYREIKRNK